MGWAHAATLVRIYLWRLIAVIATLVVGLIGLFFALWALVFSEMVLWAVVTGVLRGTDFRENTGDWTVLRATDPEEFWSLVGFYTPVSIVSWLIALALIWPVAICLRKLCSKVTLARKREPSS